MKDMKKMLALGCCAAMLAAGGALSASAEVITVGEAQVSDNYRAPEFVAVWGPVLSVTEDRIKINNISESSSFGEMVITISYENTRVLDAVNGFPVALGDLKEGEMVYAYLGPVMTMSLPPITNGITVICNAPADFKVPEFMRITKAETLEDGSMVVSGNNGRTYTVPTDCTTLPYLTRNLVTLRDLTVGRTCLLWSDENNQASKIVLFAPDRESGEAAGPGM